MKNDLIAVFAGGDRRSVHAARSLSNEVGRVCLTGFDRFPDACEGIELDHQTQHAVLQADILILPLPYTVGGGVLNAPFSERQIPLEPLFRLADRAKLICGGMLPALDERFYDYYDEPMMLRNADVTAEAALLLAGQTLSGCLNGSSAVIVGYGRIGKRLASKARALGCRVTVAARKESDRALIRMCGHEAIGIQGLPEALGHTQMVFNTVPAEIFTEAMLASVPEEVPLIDLAGSLPGKRVIRATGLPGKYAPEAAGKILADSVRGIMKREGLL